MKAFELLTTTLAVAETVASPETVRTLDVDPEIVNVIGTDTDVSIAVISNDPFLAAAAPSPVVVDSLLKSGDPI